MRNINERKNALHKTMNKRIVMGGLSIVAALTLMGGATFAQFTSSATLDNSTFATGDASLGIAADSADAPVLGYSTTITGFGPINNIAPGYSANFVFWLRNGSSSAINLDVIAKLTGVSGDEVLQDALKITFTCTRRDGTTTIAGPFSVNDWEAGSAPVGTLLSGGTADGLGSDETQCVMNVNLPLSSDSSVANKTVTFDGQFDATQAP